MKPVKIGLCGLGTVGKGTFNVLKRNAEEIARRAGRHIEIHCIASRNSPQDMALTGIKRSQNVFDIVNDPEIDILVELIGGSDPARELVLQAIAKGKHVVTANKALIACYGNEIFTAAQEKGVMVAFEAAVAGGIPIIKAIREGLAANRILWVAGIINGTSNYILTEMREKGRSFQDVLQEAQALGYAEADPTFDIEGIDAAHKLTILASIAFGIPLQFSKAYIEGITKITAEDVHYAEELGYRIKLLGITKRTDRGIELRVHPTLVSQDRLIANVNGVKNAVLVQGDAVGPTLYYGAGAGSDPTASAVVADIIEIVRTLTTDPNHRVPHLAFQPNALSSLPILPIQAIETAYYLCLHTLDKVGVLADITRILSIHNISIEALLQKDIKQDNSAVPIVILTNIVREQAMKAAIQQIEALDTVLGNVRLIRMEVLDGVAS